MLKTLIELILSLFAGKQKDKQIMPKITIKDGKSFEVVQGTKLTLALMDNGIDLMHKCGGKAKCTSCRVIFHAGEPEKMTVAEHDKLESKENALGVVRLSCQITVEHDMTVEVVNMANGGDAGGRPPDTIFPEPEWMDAPKG